MFEFVTNIDGSDVKSLVLAGATIGYGRTNVEDPLEPPVAVLQLLTRDAYPAAGVLYPEFGLGDWASDLSGFVDIYADVYTGVTTRLTLGVPVTVNARSSGGFEDLYTDIYAGYDSRRFTGYVNAIDYTPGTIQLTCTSKAETWARNLVGGTGNTSVPAEMDTARMQRLALEAGVTLIVDGPPSVQVTEIPKKTPPRSMFDWLFDIIFDTGGTAYTDRQDFIHIRTRDYDTGPVPTVYFPPEATLLDPLRMTAELGLVRNYLQVFYGPVPTNGDERPFVESTDQDSIDQYGRRDFVYQSSINLQADAQEWADWMNARLRPAFTMPAATILMERLSDQWIANVLDVDQGWNVVVPRLLPGSPMPDYPATVIGYTETLSTTRWEIDFHLTLRRNPGIEYSPTWIYPAPNTYEGE